MLLEATMTGDGATFARSVRAVAVQARRFLSGPSSPIEARELLRAIGSLEREARDHPSGDVSRWLASLHRRVERHAGPTC